MSEQRAASTTAMGVAWLHAVHQIVDSAPHVLEDPIIARLMGATPELLAERSERLQSDGARALRAHIVTRTRFAEDRLEHAVQRGVRQYVILGAGMDTFAYRQPRWATDLSIFEVDQPGTQGVKRQRLTEANLSVPVNLTYVAIDFEAESLADGFRRGGIQLDQPTFFAWLGVTMYLTESAIDAVLRTILTFPRSSEIVFTFVQPRSLAAPGDVPMLSAMAASVGEPWVTYFEPKPLRAKLLGLGFSVVEFLTPADTSSRYFRDRSDGLAAPRRTSIVSATV
jgi:methyltransferase (TIGR00027 family)